MLSKYVACFTWHYATDFFVFLHIQHFMCPWQHILNSLLFAVSIKNKLSQWTSPGDTTNCYTQQHCITFNRSTVYSPIPCPCRCRVCPPSGIARKKRLKAHTAHNGTRTPNPVTEVRYVTCHIWDHIVLPDTRHKWTRSRPNPSPQAVTRLTYPEGWKAELT